MANRRPKVIAEFVDEYEEKRIVHRDRHGHIRVKRTAEAVGQSLTKAVGLIAGANIRRIRKERGLTMLELARRSGLTASKQRMREIETCGSNGLRVGTIYAVAGALGVPVTAILPTVESAFNAAEVSEQRITEPTIAFSRATA